MNQWVTIRGETLSAAINPQGAELSSLTDADGREWMTDADPRFWSGRAPVLFPIVGALNGGRYRLGDAAYALPRHGFARTSRFELVEHAPDHALFRLTGSAQTRAVYPFAFALELAFRILATTLKVEARVTNPGDAPLPFSLGFHPAFAWPLPGGGAKAAHTVTFAQPEPGPIRRLDDHGLVLAAAFPSPVTGDSLTPAAALFEADAMIWDTLASRSVRFGADGGGRIEVAFPDAPMLGIWQKPGAPFLCIEPWQGIADPVGYTGDFRDKPGVVLLPPGESWRFAMDVTVLST